MRVEISANFRTNRESGRHWQPDAGHFSKIRPFATQQRFLGALPAPHVYTYFVALLLSAAGFDSFAEALAWGLTNPRFAAGFVVFLVVVLGMCVCDRCGSIDEKDWSASEHSPACAHEATHSADRTKVSF